MNAGLDPVMTVPVLWLPTPVPVSNATAKTEAEMRPYKEAVPGTKATFDMVPIPSGRFFMGSPAKARLSSTNENPQIEVELDAFWMAKCEVTWTEFEAWMCAYPDAQAGYITGLARREPRGLAEKLSFDAVSLPTEKPYVEMSFGMGKEGFPAICMSQLAAKLYCKWLCAKTGRYYRLPSEAEWEYACRAGSTTAYSFGDSPGQLAEYGWFVDNSDLRYHQVGRKKSSAWGLYDMHGNVAEWVLDAFTPGGYPWPAGKPIRNPVVVPTGVHPCVVRGGSYDDEAKDLRSASRRGSDENWQQTDPRLPKDLFWLSDATFVGFRAVRPLQSPTPAEALKYDLDETQKKAWEDLRRRRSANR
jgi:formylglycine-generating enzyme required for sulfatase activity